MSKLTIWKFPIPPKEFFTLELPRGGKVLTVQGQFSFGSQKEEPQMWVLVDPEAEKVRRLFCTVGTGHPVPEGAETYLGTFQVEEGALVFHIFEIPSGRSPS